MRGYTEPNKQTESTDLVESWSKEQCEDYLHSFPNGLSAEAVRNRLKVLGYDSAYDKKCKEEKKRSGVAGNTNSPPTFNTNQSDSEDNTGQIIFILVVAAILMVCAFYFEWRTSLKIMIVVGACVSLGKIGNNKNNN